MHALLVMLNTHLHCYVVQLIITTHIHFEKEHLRKKEKLFILTNLPGAKHRPTCLMSQKVVYFLWRQLEKMLPFLWRTKWRLS